MAEISSEKADLNNYIEGISYKEKNNSSEKGRKNSINSSKSDSFFTNLNSEIKIFMENEADMSFSSNSNSESPEQRRNIDDLLDSKYWRVNKDLSLDNEKDFFIKNKNLLLLNDNEKKLSKLFEGSNKQSIQSNEDEETRIEPLHNISDSESNNSPLISSLNNESEENENICDKLPQEIICDKTSNKEDKNKLHLNNNITKEKENKLNKDNTMNEYSINHNKLKLNDTEFIYPYEPIKNQNNNNNGFASFYQDAFLNQPFCYNLPSPISHSSILSVNSNSGNKMNNNISKNNEEEYFEKENKIKINGKNEKFIDNTSNCNKKLDQNQKDKTDLPLITNQNNLQMNYNSSKLNLNMTYYPKIQNNNLICHKQSMDKINNSSNYLSELNNKDNNISNNLSEKKIKNNNLNLNEQNNSINNTNNNLNNVIYNKMTINSYKNIATNKNMNNATNKTSLKGEKQILNLDDIVNGKDTRTTIMIRNIPIKYTEKMLNEALIEFHGKYDCLYLPYDYEKNGNKGYAFINFVNPLHILYFYERFNGKKWAHFESSKICELNSAHFQGINEIQKNVKNFKDLKKSNYYSDNNKENDMIIPSKYLLKLKKRFPKMKYNENKNKKILFVKSFE